VFYFAAPATAQVTAAAPTAVSAVTADSHDPLRFPMDDYPEETVTVTTSTSEVEATYRLYEQITYVANPVDADYQSMNVKGPIKVDGKEVDATHAPILFKYSVGGYLGE